MQIRDIFKGKKVDFFDLFEEAADNNYQAAKSLQNLCHTLKKPQVITEKINKLESKGDKISHAVFDELRTSFVVPLDREDIADLISDLDDIMDLIYLSASNIDLYNVKKTTPTAKKLADIIVDSTKSIRKALPGLRQRRTFQTVSKAVVEINNLENQADMIYKSELRHLFKNQKNPIDIMRWQNIYMSMEDIMNKCEDIADILRELVIKYV